MRKPQWQGFRDIDEARRSKCELEPLVSNTNFGFMPKQAQARMETSLNSYLANSIPFKSDIGSLRGKIECLDTQKAGQVNFSSSTCCVIFFSIGDAGYLDYTNFTYVLY